MTRSLWWKAVDDDLAQLVCRLHGTEQIDVVRQSGAVQAVCLRCRDGDLEFLEAVTDAPGC